jgi:hypothetical protein
VKQFRKYNSIAGWIVFAIAAFTYISTAESTASLWDCGEYIATSFKLEVGHPPGNPIFALMARFFTLFAGSNVELVARMVNYMSALASAFTILLLFWSITHIARKILVKKEDYSISNIAIIIGSGLVGSLAYTFSDTFWFSAVEGEVYASSSLFTALVFWAILKWEDVADEKYANRWIILIAYLMGLSIGVHLLNLLAIPAIVMIYYFRKFKVTITGIVISLLLSFVLVGFVMYGIIQGVVTVASRFELLFVNNFGLPFNTGIAFYILLLATLLLWGIYYSLKNRKVLLNTILLSIVVLLLGYMSYALVVIRAYADTPINENKPDNVFSLLSYINREQYGDRPLFYGQYYIAPVDDVIETGNKYAQINKQYEVVGHDYKAIYDSKYCTFFPRMYSSDRNHIEVYKRWGKVKGNPVEVEQNGKTNTIIVPTFLENVRFFFSYQIGHMYMRYFLWNFVGRQNDEEGSGMLDGNWITGFNIIDSKMLTPQDNLPSAMKNTPSRNVYYGLPFILGILGLFYLMDKNKRYLFITALLFFMTGLAIVIYLNQTPQQPRERDYAYAGSFYVYAMWIGLGVASIYSYFRNSRWDLAKAIGITLILLILVPGIMAKENWFDHNRSGRYTARAYAYNYLNSCAPNAILFTFGDNDTFPLWYIQEVEGIRTDVRVVNTMLFNMDWYIDQMKKKAYESDPLPISMTKDKYIGEKRDRVYIVERIKDFIDLNQAMDFVISDNRETKEIQGYDQSIDYFPGRNFIISVDKEKVLKNGTVLQKDSDKIVKEIRFTLKGNNIDKSQLGTLDILAHNNWERPIYFVACNTEGSLNLDEYFQLEGFAYRLVPIKTPYTSMLNCGRINTDLMYNNLMNRSYYGRMNDPNVYIDNFNRRTLSVVRFKNNFMRLAQALIAENKKDSAKSVLDKCCSLAPPDKVPDDMFTIGIIDAYFLSGIPSKGQEILDRYFKSCSENLQYFLSLKINLQGMLDYDIQYNLEAMRQLSDIASKYHHPDSDKIESIFEHYKKVYEANQQIGN